jgi:F-type H+-transporting ATPase subunit b
MLNSSPALGLLLSAGASGGSLQDLLKPDPTLLWATIVIFALFAFVLGKFAWGPLLKIIDERESSVREQVESAERAAAEGRELLAKHQELVRNAGREREEILARAAKEAEAVHAEIVGKARAEAEAVVVRAREQMARDKDRAVAELRGQVADLAVEAASRIVRSSLNEDAQRRLVDDYIRALPGSQAGGPA